MAKPTGRARLAPKPTSQWHCFYTGQRRGDVVKFGRQHVKDGVIHFVMQKDESRSLKKMAIPIAPELRKIIDSSPTGDLNFLVTERNKPFTAAGVCSRSREGAPDDRRRGRS